MTDISLRPMLASPVVWSKLTYPKVASPKIDGFRCMILNGVAYSRSGKPIRNAHFQLEVARYATQLNGLDGELIIGADPTAPDLLRHTSSAFNSTGGTPEFTYYVFDSFLNPMAPWQTRFDTLTMRMVPRWTQFVSHIPCQNEREVLTREEECVTEGYEGLMLRDPSGQYKFNRSTPGEGLLLKVKRFTDTEAEIIGFEEQMHNENLAFTTPQGLTKRQSLQQFKVGSGVLGSLRCKLPDGTEFNIGTGFDAALREQLWRNRDSHLGQLVTFKSVPYGEHEAPRFPVFKSLRSRDDL